MFRRSTWALIPAAIVAVVLGASYFAPARLGGINLVAVCSYGAGGAPTVTGVSPTAGTTAGGTSVTITGCGFTGATAVDFGTTAATGFTVNSDSQVTATSPAHAAGTVDVTVTTSLGKSATSAADQFTYKTGVCSSVTVSAAPSSPRNAGTTVTFTATPTSTNASPDLQFWLLPPGGSAWQIAQAYSTSTTWSWNTTGLAPGTYQIIVWCRDAFSSGANSNSGGTWDSYAYTTYGLMNPFFCTGAGLSALPASPQNVGTAVTVTATSSGCPHASPLFQFWLLAPGASAWQMTQAYSTTATWPWSTTGLPQGTYQIAVWVKDAQSNGTYGNSFGRWDAVAIISYTLTGPHCTGVTLSAVPASTDAVGTSPVFTATASGCPHANPQYQFWTLAPGASAWTIAQAYSTTNTFTWNTTGGQPGGWQVAVWARDANSTGAFSNSFGTWDAFAGMGYTVTTCTGLTLSAAPASTDAVGHSPLFTATATGCPDASPVYQFWLHAPGASSWTVAQAYSTTNTFTWNTTGVVPGTWQVAVWVRDAKSGGAYSNSFGTWDLFASLSYTVTTCTGVSLSASPAGSTSPGTPVTFTATASGCPNPNPSYEFWILAPGASSWTMVQAYSTTNTFTWVTTGKAAGTYQVAVWARDADSGGAYSNSFGTWDAVAIINYSLT